MKFRQLLTGALAICLLAGCAAQKTVADPAPETSVITETSTVPETQETAPVSYENAVVLELSGMTAAADGTPVETYDYTWHCDPTAVHDEVKNAPAEYYTGTKPETEAAVYIDHDLQYFPQLPEDWFTLENYDGEAEWTAHYQDGTNDAYLFGTLPRRGSSLPTQMMHTEAEAAENAVLHITQPGTYVLRGSWNGQIRMDVGETDDPNAKVTLVLSGAEITCTVAPAVLFASAYECGGAAETSGADVDTADAGVTVILVDGTKNTVSGTNIYRMLAPVYKDEAAGTQKKLRKLDGAFYSCVSMNIAAEPQETGTLEINSGFEGLDSELHLTVLGGNLTINAQDDGINVNEDHVSVACFAGGNVTINPALGTEGDGVDSNGYIVVKGGTVSVNGVRAPDSPLDSDDGTYYEGGTVIVDGMEQAYQPGSEIREDFGFGGMGGRGEPSGFGEMGEFDLQAFKEAVAALPEDATREDVLALLGMGFGGGGFGGEPGREPGMQPGGFGGNPGGQPMGRP